MCLRSEASEYKDVHVRDRAGQPHKCVAFRLPRTGFADDAVALEQTDLPRVGGLSRQICNLRPGRV